MISLSGREGSDRSLSGVVTVVVDMQGSWGNDAFDQEGRTVDDIGVWLSGIDYSGATAPVFHRLPNA